MNKQLSDIELIEVSGGTDGDTRQYAPGQLYLSSGMVFKVLIVNPDNSCLVAVFQKINNDWYVREGDAYPFSMMDSWLDVSDDPEYASIASKGIPFKY